MAGIQEWAEAAAGRPGELIDVHHIRGMIHAHSKWSDGVHTGRRWALAARSVGAEHTVSDRSLPVSILCQWIENLIAWWLSERRLRLLNRQLALFRIFHGIESDILYSGS